MQRDVTNSWATISQWIKQLLLKIICILFLIYCTAFNLGLKNEIVLVQSDDTKYSWAGVGMSSLKSVRESSVQMWLDRLRRGLQGWMKTKAHRVNPRTQNSEVGEAEPAKDSGTPNETGGSPDGSVSWKPGPGTDRNQIHTRRCVISPSVVSSSLDPMDCSIQAPLSMEFSRQEYWRGLPFPAPSMLLRGQLNRETPTGFNHVNQWKQVHWDDPEGWYGEEGGFRMGNTCIPVADACWYMAKPIQYCKVKK